nr:hypothetical protein [Tanacetum cinerariifolium]
MTEAEQIKLATKRSLQQTHISQASRSGVDKGTGILLGVPDVPTDESDEEISWMSSDEDDDDVDDQSDAADDDDQEDDDQDDNDDDQDSDNDGDDFVHPKLSTHDEEAKDEESFDPIVQTPSQVEKSDDESNDDESHGINVWGDEGLDAKDDDEELYRDVNINLEGRDVQMTDFHTTQGDVPVTTTVVPLLVTAPTLPLSSIPIMSQVQQAPTPTPTTAPSTSLQDLPDLALCSDLTITSYTVAIDLSQLELKKIQIKKMESNKDTVTLKRRCDDVDKDKEPFAGSDRGSKRKREGKEPKSTSDPKEKASKTTGKSTEGSKSHQKTASESAPADEPIQTIQYLEEPSHQEFETGAADDQPIA